MIDPTTPSGASSKQHSTFLYPAVLESSSGYKLPPSENPAIWVNLRKEEILLLSHDQGRVLLAVPWNAQCALEQYTSRRPGHSMLLLRLVGQPGPGLELRLELATDVCTHLLANASAQPV